VHTLLTIPFSHYNEKARWALDRFGVQYRERKYMPMLHVPAVAVATRFGKHGGSDKVSTRFSTPVLITTDGERLCDSHDIVRWVDDTHATPETTLFPTPHAEAIERELGEGLGPHARRVAYGLGMGKASAFSDLARNNVGWVQWRTTQIFGPFMVGMIARGLRIDPPRVEKSIDAVRKVFDDIGRRLEGRRYLDGDRFSVADLAFACLSAAVLVPTRSEGFGAALPERSELTPRAAALADELRATAAGQYAMRLFRDDRGAVVRRPLG
jgi:glutathione S-transferase